jgi:hypothetical protein
MKYNKEKFIANVKRAVTELKVGPSTGKVCAVATLRTIRDMVIDDLFGDESASSEEDKATAQNIREGFLEIIKEVAKDGASDGFASNASAAAKAAGFKTGETEPVNVEGMKD